jgi:dUTP pyrophosphatase
MKIKQLRDLSEDGVDLQQLVKYAHPEDVGIDLVACEKKYLPLNGIVNIPTGIAMGFNSASFGLILPRSSLASLNGISVLGGVIDEGYTGEIIVHLANNGPRDITFFPGDRIAQLVVLPYYRVSLQWLDKDKQLPQTVRGDRGHGSSGA